ncbi:hypothetical protein QAD02_024293 [Eretmocerus hayati]|uniref:Uncharacterized protein n=1 Tax=Eretmocerus hayati TaxID=131215 RepID=A0ACC2PZX4_9HYME|nr:hypothetical protein QAD02_024293 [Eretmocerus hayati]
MSCDHGKYSRGKNCGSASDSQVPDRCSDSNCHADDDWKKTLLLGYNFKLKGFRDETEEYLIKIIQDLGGAVSDYADCTLSDVKYFRLCKGSLKNDLFCIEFIRDSIIAKKALNILRYKFSRYQCMPENSQNGVENHSTTETRPLSEQNKSFSTWHSRSTQPQQIQCPKQGSKLKFNPYNKSSDDREDCYVVEQIENRNQYHSETQLKVNPRKRKMTSTKVYWYSTDVSQDRACKKKKCTFEPGLHQKHLPAGEELSIEEEKTIIKYLITFNLIKECKKKQTYKDLVARGYLTHREPGTLRHHFRTQILCDINEYGLPSEIVEKFRNLQS